MIWDTVGTERFKCITYAFYKNANGIFITFDLNNK